ncbi:tRNA pseudouridine synthase B [bacterium BMS3Bbin02]|nr:tRNA pseudouridine synthase B [bacterium BMS3Bbin02]
MQGFLLVDKPRGWTSHDVVAKMRGLLRTKKIGHAGTLDPMATGLLVLGVGACTKLLRFVQEGRKRYEASALFGVATDTLDADGTVVEERPLQATEQQIRTAARSLIGNIEQVPPMTSAIKIDGRRLYELAREGKEIERPARPVTIYDLAVTDVEMASETATVTFSVTCSKGTYVRTLADDIARGVGSRAHLTALRRTANGSLSVAEAHTIDALQTAADEECIGEMLLPAVDGLPDLARFDLPDELASRVRNGAKIDASEFELEEGAYVRMVNDGSLLAVYETKGAAVVPAAVMPS